MLKELINKKIHAADPSAPVGTSNNPSTKVFTVANCVSFARIILTLIFFFLFINHENRFICLAIYAAAALTDFLDGQIARRTQTVSWVGKLLDPAVDRLLLLTGVVGLCWVRDLPLWIPLTIVGRDIIVGIGMLIIRPYRRRPLDVLYIGKVATAFLMVGFCWLLLGLPVLQGFGWLPVSWLPLLNTQSACVGILVVYVGTVLSVITGIGYVLEEVQVLREAKSSCKKTLSLILAALLTFSSLGFSPRKPFALEVKPELSDIPSYLITDSVGTILAEKNSLAQLPPASITKIMTAMVALDSDYSWDAEITVPPLPTFQEGAQLAGYKEGEKTSFKDVFDVMLVYSANDAAYILASWVGRGDINACLDKMNEKARALGMEHTHFSNPHGLSDQNHYSCAKDLTIMGRYALEHYPNIAQTIQLPEVTAPIGTVSVSFETTDQFLTHYPFGIGIKTGAIDDQYTFLGASRKENTILYSCVLGAPSREESFQATIDLMDWAWNSFSVKTLVDKGSVIRFQPFSYDPRFVVPVVANQQAEGDVWPFDSASDTKESNINDEDGLVFLKNHLLQASVPLAAGEPVGYMAWYQGRRLLNITAFSTEKPQLKGPAINRFFKPLFPTANVWH